MNLCRTLCGSLLVLAALRVSPARAELVDRVVAIVNNEVITLSELEARSAQELANVAADGDPTRRIEQRREVLSKTLDAMIGEQLLNREVKALGLDVTESELEQSIDNVKKTQGMSQEQLQRELERSGFTMESYRTYLRQHLQKMKLVNMKVRSKVKVSDQDLKAAYDKEIAGDDRDFEIHARHALISLSPQASREQVEEAQQKAQAIAELARRPGADFAAIAKARSEGPTAQTGGDLGFFRRGVMQAEFERAAFALKPNQVSDPVRTRFGWHVIKVEERRAIAPPSFDEIKEQLREKLLQSQMEQYTDLYLKELRNSAAVEVKL